MISSSPGSSERCSRAHAETIRIKVGVVIVRNKRRVRFLIASAFPLRALFLGVARRLDTTQPLHSTTPAH